MVSGTFVVVGGGLAGAKGVEALRARGFDGRLVLVGAEPRLPYERPPLSKDFMLGKAPLSDAEVHDRHWYDAQRIELRLGTAATRVDRAAHEVELAGGERIGYAKLLLATGSNPRRLPLSGADAEGVLYLRKAPDAEEIKASFQPGAQLVVIGAGWIGLEVAAAARQAGVEVTIVESASTPLSAALGPELGEVFGALHREHGVDLRTGVTVDEVTTDAGRVAGVRLGDGTVLDADRVLIGIGAVPDLALAEDAGLDVEGGVLVDASLRTSDPDIYAAGDIAAEEHPFLGARIRVEHWANALNQPAVAAAGMLGEPAVYDELPYFFTDQYDLGMEYVGHVPPGSTPSVVVRGALPSREFIAFWLDEQQRVLAGMNVNIWDVVEAVKTLVHSREPVDPARLADTDVALEALTSPA